jgi:hypothetical protein
MTPVILFVEWVCGPNYESMTYGERDAKIIHKAEELGWDLTHLDPDGWYWPKAPTISCAIPSEKLSKS